LKSALQRLLQQGMRPPDGARMPGLKDLLDKLRAQKQQRMQRYDLGSSLEDIAKKLDDVVKTEREGIERDLKGREREKRQQALHRMLRERAEGGQPDFEKFKQKWGEQFPGAESLDDVLEQIGRRMAAMQSLMQSLSPEQRAQLDDMMRSLFLKDERLEAAMR